MTNLGALQGDWYSGAFGINAGGQIAGISRSFTDHAVVFYNGTITNLTALTGMAGGAQAINDNGEVVGLGELTGQLNGPCHAYDFTTKTDLGTLGGQNSDAYGINNSGQIVGYAATASGAWHPFLYSNGHMIDLGSFDDVYTAGTAFEINNAGQIVGDMENPATGAYRAFLYSGGVTVHTPVDAASRRVSRRYPGLFARTKRRDAASTVADP
jgi:probable HAF family extracellular repeat protein